MPLAESWLKCEEQFGGRATLKGTPGDMRGQFDDLVAALVPLLPPFPEGSTVEDGKVNVEDGREVGYRSYVPKDGDGPFPIAIWTHGGGYMLGDLNSDDFLCRVVADNTKSTVVSVDYRLAPEYKWPAQLDDSVGVYKWAIENASKIKGDPNKVYTIGGSAGGGLAFQVANQVLRDEKLKKSLKGIVAMVPVTCHWDNVPSKYASKYKSYEENAKDAPVIDKESMEIFYEHTMVNPKDPDCFTILATDKHAEFPPTYFTSCEFDPLRDDTTIMIEALKEAGVPTKHDYYPGFPHYFWIFPPVPESQEFVGKLLQGIEWVKSQM